MEDWRDNQGDGDAEGEQRDAERQPYEIERIATALAVTFMFLAALYSIFAILLFLYFGSKDDVEEEVEAVTSNKRPLASIANDPRRENFITMGESA